MCCSITELAEAEKINRSYVCRVLRLTLLAPEIVEMILEGRQPESVALPALIGHFRWSGRGRDSAVRDSSPGHWQTSRGTVSGTAFGPYLTPSLPRVRRNIATKADVRSACRG